MSASRWPIVAVIVLSTCGSLQGQTGGLRIPWHRSSISTPVQKLNRDGVEAIRKHRIEKAKELFYKAYLYDPDDPFTLNNLGYIAELEGRLERARRFYALAAQEKTGAVVDRASLPQVEGRPIANVLADIGNVSLEVNRDNIDAMHLLSQGRVHEAETLLQRTLEKEPNNAFTLNNLGVAKEIQGEDQAALRLYDAATNAGRGKLVIVSRDDDARGKTVDRMASENARKLRESMQGQQSAEVRAARFNLRGVAAINRNDVQEARQDFRRASALDSSSAFTLNNLGYLSELDGDWESAQSYYELAQKAYRAEVRIGLATRASAEGEKLSDVAEMSGGSVEARMAAAQRIRRMQGGPIELKRRDQRPVDAPPASPQVPPPPR